MNADTQYFELVKFVLEKGRLKKNRTGTNTIGAFGAQARYDLSKGFPLLTTKKVFMKGITHELLWFLKGDTNIKYLVDNDVHIWDEWAYQKYLNSTSWVTSNDEQYKPIPQKDFIMLIRNSPEFANQWGELGKGTYGWGWRSFGRQEFNIKNGYCDDETHNWFGDGTDQITKLIDGLTNNPDSRRHLVSAWHPHWVDHCALPPCHVLFQFHTEELSMVERLEASEDLEIEDEQDYELFDKANEYADVEVMTQILDKYNIPNRRLNCQLYQRSADLFLGVPFNIASYALLLSMVAQVTNMVPGEFIHSFGDIHIYENHLEQLQLQMSREPKAAPKLVLNPAVTNIFDFKYEDIKIEGYDPHPAIKGEVAV